MTDSSRSSVPNIGWTLRDNTPSSLDIRAGFFVDVLGDSSEKTFNIVEGAAVQGLNPGVTVNLEAASDAFTFTRNGTTLEIRDGADNIVAQIAGGADNSTVRFANGATELGVDFSAGELTFAGQSLGAGDRVSGSAAGIELDGSDTSGRFFDTGPDEVDLDALGSTDTRPVMQDAGDGEFSFIDGVSAESNTEITRFGRDDEIKIRGVSADEVFLQVSDGNTEIQFDDGSGTVSQITLSGVSGLFTSPAQFNSDPSLGNIVFESSPGGGDPNQNPTIPDQSFTVVEDGTGGPFTVAASDSDGSVASFAITGGNDPDGNDTDAFAIDDNGVLTVAISGELKDGMNDPYTLDVEVADNEDATATGTVTVGIDPASGAVDLDDLGGTDTTAATFDAGSGEFEFTDSVYATSNTEISNYSDDDSLVFEGVTADDVSVSVSGGSTDFVFSDGGGTVSKVELAGVTGFFTSVNEFNADANLGDLTFA